MHATTKTIPTVTTRTTRATMYSKNHDNDNDNDLVYGAGAPLELARDAGLSYLEDSDFDFAAMLSVHDEDEHAMDPGTVRIEVDLLPMPVPRVDEADADAMVAVAMDDAEDGFSSDDGVSSASSRVPTPAPRGAAGKTGVRRRGRFPGKNEADFRTHEEWLRYRDKRDRNNIAANRSREAKQRRIETALVRADELERENAEMRVRAARLEDEIKHLRVLVAKMSKNPAAER
eukprot:Unigene2042_Nuclearia_a/m.6360 Unigene2042_Nuclearia_a/g.6360  ORF Unigene2042_Nuclearia_a/g.6360 Unigene2042_Nuclearia_a/m.6360 type:complete len:231 (+) Unigene2042_Nuclearia_a:254-946(+)